MTSDNIKPIRDWMPGLPGKGFMLASGQIVLWNIDNDGHPEHAEKAQQMTGKRHDYTGAITIAPDGTACRASALTNTPLPSDGDEALVAAANANIKLVEDHEQVTKAKLHAYAHAENLAAIATRKAAPVKLAAMPEEVSTWLGKLKGDESAKWNSATGVHTPAKCDNWKFVFGSKTWTRTGIKEDERARKMTSYLPGTCCPRAAQETERVRAGIGLDAEGFVVWGPSTFWLSINVPFGMPRHLRRQIGEFLQAKLEEAGSSLIYYPHDSMPEPYATVAYEKWEADYDAKTAELAAAKKAREGTPEECAAVLEAMEGMRNPDKHRTFTCTLDIEIASGVASDRILGVLETLARKRTIHSGGFYTRAKKDGREMGAWWAISNPKPLSKVR